MGRGEKRRPKIIGQRLDVWNHLTVEESVLGETEIELQKCDDDDDDDDKRTVGKRGKGQLLKLKSLYSTHTTFTFSLSER